MPYNIWPTRDQWRKWSLPSKLTAVGALLGTVSLIVTILSAIQSLPTKDASVQPRSPADVPPITLEAVPLEKLVAMGHRSFSVRQFQQAIDYYSKALSIDPNDAETWRKKGIAYISLSMPEADFATLIDNAGHLQQEYFEAALPCLDRALQINPNDKEAYLYRGLVWYRRGTLHPMLGPPNSTKNAYSQFEAALKIPGNRPDIDPYKWSHETSCAYYGMAKVMERIQVQNQDGTLDHPYREEAEQFLQKARGVVPSCIPPGPGRRGTPPRPAPPSPAPNRDREDASQRPPSHTTERTGSYSAVRLIRR